MLSLTSFFDQLSLALNTYQARQKIKSIPGFNIFQLISAQYQRENLHSDIIGFLLNPAEKHEAGCMFLDGFLEFLAMIPRGPKLKSNASLFVEREKSRIDITILDAINHEAIIIENKMNNAPDQDRQLFRYYQKLEKRGYRVTSIVYLSLDGSKVAQFPGYSEHEIRIVNELLSYVPAFHTDLPNLTHNWLIPSCARISNIDVLATVRQYTNLLQNLYKKNMDYPALAQLYSVIGQNAHTYDTALSVRAMMDDLKEFLAQRILRLKKEKAQSVFSTVDIYKHPDEGVFAVFSGCDLQGFNFTIDVEVQDKEYHVTFFERAGRLNEGNDPIKGIVAELGWINDVKYYPEMNRYLKVFPIPGGDDKLEKYLDTIIDYLAVRTKNAVLAEMSTRE